MIPLFIIVTLNGTNTEVAVNVEQIQVITPQDLSGGCAIWFGFNDTNPLYVKESFEAITETIDHWSKEQIKELRKDNNNGRA